MCRLFLCPHCPLLQPIGGPGTEAYLWGGVRRRCGSLEGNSFLLPKPHKGLDTDLRVMCSGVVYPLSSPTTPTTFPSFLLAALSPYHPSLLLDLPPVDPLLPHPSALCAARLTELVSAERGWMLCLSIG